MSIAPYKGKKAVKKTTSRKSDKLPITHLQFLVLKILQNGPKSGPALKNGLKEFGASGLAAIRAVTEAGYVTSRRKGTVIFRGRAITENEYTLMADGLKQINKSKEFYQ